MHPFDLEIPLAPLQQTMSSSASATSQMQLAYEAGLRRGWSAHRQMDPVFPEQEFWKWLRKRAPIDVVRATADRTPDTQPITR